MCLATAGAAARLVGAFAIAIGIAAIAAHGNRVATVLNGYGTGTVIVFGAAACAALSRGFLRTHSACCCIRMMRGSVRNTEQGAKRRKTAAVFFLEAVVARQQIAQTA